MFSGNPLFPSDHLTISSHILKSLSSSKSSSTRYMGENFAAFQKARTSRHGFVPIKPLINVDLLAEQCPIFVLCLKYVDFQFWASPSLQHDLTNNSSGNVIFGIFCIK